MPARDLIGEFGQLFTLAFDGTELPIDVAEFFRVFQVGGVILFADNYHDPEQLRELCVTIQATCRTDSAPHLFIATDHEGGRVQRFRDGFTALPPAADLGRQSPERTYEVYARAARELARAGINVNLAPVADLCAEDRPGAIGARSFGEDPGTTAAHVSAAIRAIQDERLMACVKHFPGHGSTDEDSHRVLPVVTSDLARLRSHDLQPFEAAIRADVTAVMTGHVLYPGAGQGERPASVSRYWHRFLRDELGFGGLIVTDALEMGGLRSIYDPLEAGAAALEAGADLIILYKEGSEFEAVYRLRESFCRGELDPATIERGLGRVRRAKARLFGPPPG